MMRDPMDPRSPLLATLCCAVLAGCIRISDKELEDRLDWDDDGFVSDRFGGDDNAGAFYLDLVTLRETLESQAGEMLPPEYASEMLPYLEPLDFLAGVTRVDNGTAVTSYGLVLR